MNTVRRRRLVRTNELTCITSYIFSACRKPGEVIAPMLTCSIMPLTATLLHYVAYVGTGKESAAPPPPRPPPAPRQQKLSAVALRYSIYCGRAGYVSQELMPRKQHCPKATCTSGEIRPPRHPHCPNTPLINISLEAMARQGSKESPFTCNCHCCHENICFQVDCQTSVFSSKL